MKALNILIIPVLLLLGSCGEPDSSKTAMDLIAGDGNKAWRLKREPGLKNRATQTEKQEVMVFDTNYTFVTSTLSETSAGHWNYHGTNLTMQFYDNGEMPVFEMKELKENKMRWKAADESEFVLTTR